MTYYHGTCIKVFQPGETMKPGLGHLSAMYVHTGASMGYDSSMVECQNDEIVPRTEMVWLSTDVDEAEDWGQRQAEKATWKEMNDTTLFPITGTVVYEVEPLGPVHFPLHPHSPKECCTPKARIVREVRRTVWDLGEDPYPDED